MPTQSRDKAIKLLVAKFIKLVESLDPGERLSIRKIAAKKSARPGKRAQAAAKPANTRADVTKANRTKKARPRTAK
jgi:hypothetical protein